MAKNKVTYITDSKRPLWFGDYEGQSLEEIIEFDKLYVISLLKNLRYDFDPKVVKRLSRIFESKNIPAMSKYKRIPTFTVKDLAGKRVGYFILDRIDLENSDVLNEKNMAMDLTITDGVAVAIVKQPTI